MPRTGPPLLAFASSAAKWKERYEADAKELEACCGSGPAPAQCKFHPIPGLASNLPLLLEIVAPERVDIVSAQPPHVVTFQAAGDGFDPYTAGSASFSYLWTATSQGAVTLASPTAAKTEVKLWGPSLFRANPFLPAVGQGWVELELTAQSGGRSAMARRRVPIGWAPPRIPEPELDVWFEEWRDSPTRHQLRFAIDAICRTAPSAACELRRRASEIVEAGATEEALVALQGEIRRLQPDGFWILEPARSKVQEALAAKGGQGAVELAGWLLDRAVLQAADRSLRTSEEARSGELGLGWSLAGESAPAGSVRLRITPNVPADVPAPLATPLMALQFQRAGAASGVALSYRLSGAAPSERLRMLAWGPELDALDVTVDAGGEVVKGLLPEEEVWAVAVVRESG